MQDQRRSMRDAKWSFDKMRFDETTTYFTFDSRHHPPGWRGDTLASWRMFAITGSLWRCIALYRTTRTANGYSRMSTSMP